MKTMKHNPVAVTDYSFEAEDELFLDTNIWLLVYGPQKPGDRRVAIYSQALANILAAKSRIYIDVLIVSEFINTYARLKWNVMGKPHGDFKLFRNSADFKPISRDIAADVKQVLNHCSRVENGFETLDIDALIAEYAAGDADFNDQVITALCHRKGLKLITDDGDFHGQGIPVVTANRRLLA
ncbi:MAG: PIN domain-containing protein [Zetaproteobacteria bacterium CG_4_9_14_3_um_filter_49_83]|nr:MAG: PIN domain-containing protein [Zetaproteobacteria bacterium CG17_big_fil_post_rev_8_21_14_2_50_50_13]PIV30182.1 MAG: PIN domain-containing protein [Zetaproteobacteria bacterium CG02_land_8_20_14_3_00_50_9]PIY54872.1 MAG: PIN domain-containing protein [Zetaproteobacteria bacterium CG_4_10_14_0_8_um_filter_49_80]PJA35202.1 MAG: PIN domain-containing protein [Zetaproteobacteria bacterium CG_4_9_14_3_um_filter_49_83]